ncbi:hypothetical protein HDV05_007324, partial [Chytridiales sp. JEL 0842]
MSNAAAMTGVKGNSGVKTPTTPTTPTAASIAASLQRGLSNCTPPPLPNSALLERLPEISNIPLSVSTSALQYGSFKDSKRSLFKSLSADELAASDNQSSSTSKPKINSPLGSKSSLYNPTSSKSFWSPFKFTSFPSFGKKPPSKRASTVKVWVDPEQIVGSEPGFVARIIRYLIDGREVMRLRGVSRVWKFALEGLVGTQEIRLGFSLRSPSNDAESSKEGQPELQQLGEIRMMMTDLYTIEPGVQAVVFTPSLRQAPLAVPLNRETLNGIKVSLPTCLKARSRRRDSSVQSESEENDENLMPNVSYSDGFITFSFQVHQPDNSWLHHGRPPYDPSGDISSLYSDSGSSTPLLSPTSPNSKWSLDPSHSDLSNAFHHKESRISRQSSYTETTTLSETPRQAVCLATRFILHLDPTHTRIVSLILPGTSPITYHIEQLKNTAIDRADGNYPTTTAERMRGLSSPEYLKPYIQFPSPPLHFYSRLYSLTRWHALRTLLTMTEACGNEIMNALDAYEEVQVEGGLVIKCPNSAVVRQLLSCEVSELGRAYYPIFIAILLGSTRVLSFTPESKADSTLHRDSMVEYQTITRLISTFSHIQNRIDILLEMSSWTVNQLSHIQRLASRHNITLLYGNANALLERAISELGEEHPLPTLMMSVAGFANKIGASWSQAVLTHEGKPIMTSDEKGLSLPTKVLNAMYELPTELEMPDGDKSLLFSVPASPMSSASPTGSEKIPGSQTVLSPGINTDVGNSQRKESQISIVVPPSVKGNESTSSTPTLSSSSNPPSPTAAATHTDSKTSPSKTSAPSPPPKPSIVASGPQPVTPQLLQNLFTYHNDRIKLQRKTFMLYCSMAAQLLLSLPGGEAFARITGFNGKIGKLGELASLHIVPVNASGPAIPKQRHHFYGYKKGPHSKK